MADVDQSVSAIDQKNSENNGDSTSDENQSDWVGFMKSIVTNFLFISVFIIIGSNFIFYIYYERLDDIFPVKRNEYFKESPTETKRDLAKSVFEKRRAKKVNQLSLFIFNSLFIFC